MIVVFPIYTANPENQFETIAKFLGFSSPILSAFLFAIVFCGLVISLPVFKYVFRCFLADIEMCVYQALLLFPGAMLSVLWSYMTKQSSSPGASWKWGRH